MKETTYIAETQTPHSFRVFLQQEYVRRRQSNAQYSLRAFARFLTIESSELSKLLTGKRQISPAMFHKLADRFQMSPMQRELFHQSLVTKRKTTADETKSNYMQLPQDSFQLIADWYHYAILELIGTKSFSSDHRWIAKRLNISVSEVNSAVERLLRLEMLVITDDGRWLDRSGAVTNITGPYTNSARKLLQKQILAQAIQAIDEIAVEERDNTSMTMAIDSTRLPMAREMIRKFRRELCDFLQDSPNKDSVYQLGVALFPATAHLKEKIHD